MAKLTSAQIRKIIKAHNIEETVKIPTGLKQAELEKFVESKGFTINHDEKSISKGGKKITLEQAEKVTAPKQKSVLQKQKAVEKKEEKAVEQKKKERELKKEAVKKATKDMVPKTSMPNKVGSKPVPKKEEPKKGKKIQLNEQAKEVQKKILEKKKKKEEPKKGKKIQLNEQAKEVQKKIVEKKKKKELEAKKPKRKQLGETKKPSDSAVVQPGKPEDLQIKKKKTVVKNKKPKPPTDEEVFDSALETILGIYYDNLLPDNVGEKDYRRLKKESSLLNKIWESKKTSKFTKPELSVLERAVSVAKANDIRNSKKFEEIVAGMKSSKPDSKN